MSTEFNPYLQWLGIRETQRPIHHYRLLGLEAFESDANVISMAADRQMAHLRTFQAGPHGELVQKLLNEISAAKICLLKPERKAAYDAQLRAKLTSPARPAAPAVAAPSALPVATNFPNVTVSSPATVAKKPPRAKNRWTPWAILAGLVVLCGILTTILIKSNQPDPEKIAIEDPQQPKTPKVDKNGDTQLTSTKSSSPNENPASETGTGKKPVSPMPEVPPKKKLPENPPNPSLGTANIASKSPAHDDRKMTQLIATASNTMVAQIATQAISASAEQEPRNVTEPKTSPAEPETPMLPDKAAIAAKAKEIRDIFKEEYASKKPEERVALAKKLYQSAQEQQEDRVTKLVLLQEARDLALQLGESEVAILCTKQLSAEFQEELGESLVAAFTKLVAIIGRPPVYYQSLLGQAATAITELQTHDEYDAALRIANISQALARRLNDVPSVTLTTTVIKELTQLKSLFSKARTARETLKENPEDPSANQTWGEFLCFAKNDFDTGLKHLAKGSDPELIALAKRDLAQPQETDKLLALGDEWWAASEAAKDRVRNNMRSRAIMHYQAVKPQLTGLAATKVEKRIAEMLASGGNTDLEWRRLLLATPWTITWKGGSKDVIKFKPNGVSENHLFVVWELAGGELILRSAPQNPMKVIAKIKLVNGQYVANFQDLITNRTDTGIAIPGN